MKIWIKVNPQASATRKEDRRKWLRKQWDAEKERNPNFGPAYEKKVGITRRVKKARNRKWLTCLLEMVDARTQLLEKP